MSKFPKGFLWGASTSAYQVEGGITQDDKVLSSMDLFGKSEKYPKGVTDFSVATDHYNHWKEDVKLMAEMGFKSYRFSISWPRIMKNAKGEVNEKGIKFYNDLLDELIKYKIEPVVTIFHFDTPVFLEEVGGIGNPEFSNQFEMYSKVLFEAYGSKIKYWLTINELNMFAIAADIIGVAAGKNVSKWQVMHYLNVAQAKAINLCHKMLPNAKIGPAPNISSVYANTSKPEDYLAKMNMDYIRNWVYLDATCRGTYNPFFLKFLENMKEKLVTTKEEMEIMAKAKPDFIAFNYYSTMTVKMPESVEQKTGKVDQQSGFKIPNHSEAVKNDNLQKTEFGWEIDPIGFRTTLREVYDRYQLPVMITENGIGAKDTLTDDGKIHDEYRIEYYEAHFKQMALAISDGVDMIGYMPWSAIDLISTHEGVSKRYGFIYVNRDEEDLKDLKRYRKDSFYWYKDIISTNGGKY